MSKNLSIAECARRLDREKPDWYKLVDISILHMPEGSKCILGQVFKDEAQSNPSRWANGFEYGWTRLGFQDGYPNTIPIAFTASGDKNLWKKEINIRLNTTTHANANSKPLWDADRLDLTIHPDGTITGKLK